MRSEQHFAEFLRKKGYRLTPQRIAILETLQHASKHLTPQEVYELSRSRVPGMTESTVYRTLSFLCEQELAMCTNMGTGNLVYEIASNLHHHLVCRECGHSIEIEQESLDNLYTDLKKQTGYALDDRHVTLFGLCAGCQ